MQEERHLKEEEELTVHLYSKKANQENLSLTKKTNLDKFQGICLNCGKTFDLFKEGRPFKETCKVCIKNTVWHIEGSEKESLLKLTSLRIKRKADKLLKFLRSAD